MDTNKVCKKCLISKPVSHFGKDLRVKSGLKARCNECCAEYKRTHKDEWGMTQAAKYRIDHKIKGLCVVCNNKAVFGHTMCINHLKYGRIQRYKKTNKLRENRKCTGCSIPLIEGEGMKCVNCVQQLRREGRPSKYADYIRSVTT